MAATCGAGGVDATWWASYACFERQALIPYSYSLVFLGLECLNRRVLAPCGELPPHHQPYVADAVRLVRPAPTLTQVSGRYFASRNLPNIGSTATAVCTSCPNTLAASCDAKAKDVTWCELIGTMFK